jgi:hypothetical protein
MPPKKITAPGAAALQPLDTNQETLSPGGSKPEEKGHKSNIPGGGGVGPRDQGHGNHPSTSAKEKRRRLLGWPIFKARSMKLLRKCASLLKTTKTEGPKHRELRQEGLFNEDGWYDNFNHDTFTFDDASPLAAEL